MSQKRARFYKTVSVDKVHDGYQVLLDRRAIYTPAKARMILPTRPLAALIAQEWRQQQKRIDPQAMPATRMANSAIDKVTPNAAAVRDLMVDYGCSDLLCYRAQTPAALRARQQGAWDPLLRWARAQYGLQFQCTTGVMPIAQPQGHRSALLGVIAGFSAFELCAFHDLVTISGSYVLALGVCANHISVQEAHNCAQIDEIWQAEKWGSDADAQQSSAQKRTELEHAKHFLDLCRN